MQTRLPAVGLSCVILGVLAGCHPGRNSGDTDANTAPPLPAPSAEPTPPPPANPPQSATPNSGDSATTPGSTTPDTGRPPGQ